MNFSCDLDFESEWVRYKFDIDLSEANIDQKIKIILSGVKEV